jgi:uncharacterized membrane protein
MNRRNKRGEAPAVKETDVSMPESDSETGLIRRHISQILENERRLRQGGDESARLVQKLTRFYGSIPFVWNNAVFFGAWILANTLLPAKLRWDPFPFIFLTLIVSLEAIFLSVFILVTANRDAVITDRRLHLDLQINLLAEEENTRMLILLNGIAKRLGVSFSEDAESKALASRTDPGEILNELDRLSKKSGD